LLVLATLHDPGLVLVSLLAVGAVVLSSRRLAKTGRLSPPSYRKALHGAVGAWTLFITPEFHHLAWAVVPPALFVIVNASRRVRALMPGIAETRSDARGLWTFPIGIVLAYVLFWEDSGRQALLAGIAALAFADPVAAWIGSRYGQRRLVGFGHGRTLEGSAAFFCVAALGAGIIAAGTQGGPFPWRMAVGCGIAGAAVESITPSGWDNVTIPLAVAAAYRYMA
jgi:dolichol kinase